MVQASAEFEDEFRAMAAEFKAVGDALLWNAPEMLRGDFAGYVRRLQRNAEGRDLTLGHVPFTTFWMLRNGTDLVGFSSLRHRLSPGLEIEGGHIGYGIRPSARLRGYGKHQLALMLDEARKIGLTRVLVTCDTDNVGSARIIQANGGVFENEKISPRTGKRVSRYWITL